MTTLLNNIDPKTLTTTVSMVVTTPKPRVVKLLIQPDEANDSFSLWGRGAPGFALHCAI